MQNLNFKICDSVFLKSRWLLDAVRIKSQLFPLVCKVKLSKLILCHVSLSCHALSSSPFFSALDQANSFQPQGLSKCCFLQQKSQLLVFISSFSSESSLTLRKVAAHQSPYHNPLLSLFTVLIIAWQLFLIFFFLITDLFLSSLNRIYLPYSYAGYSQG